MGWLFATVEERAEALRAFEPTYNEQRLIGRHGNGPPGQVRGDLAAGLPAAA